MQKPSLLVFESHMTDGAFLSLKKHTQVYASNIFGSFQQQDVLEVSPKS